MKPLKFYCVFSLAAVFVLSGLCPAQVADSLDQGQVVVATGIGSIVAGDVAHARDDAINDALRTGLEQALGMLLESETLVENYQLIEDNIFSKTRGYVQSYEVIRERKRDEQLYEVTVRAVVKIANLKNDLDGIATLMRRKNMPRTMVMIKERNVGEAPGMFHYFDVDLNISENALTSAMMEKGFKFVDRSTVMAKMERDQASAILAGNNDLAASIGRSVGAEIVITGQAVASATQVEVFGAQQRSQQAVVTIRAIRSDTGEIIAVADGQGAYPHINDIVGGTKAIQKASTAAAETLIDKILARWQSDVGSSATITLNIYGISGYQMLSGFKTNLPYYVRGIESLNQRSWNGGYAVLDIQIQGSSDDLAQRLSGKTIGGSLVKVTGMTQNSVTIELSAQEE